MRRELGTPFTIRDVTHREPEPLPLDAYDDQAETGPRVEPPVKQPQLGRAGLELEEAQGGAKTTLRIG